jgi:hypothetical protein
MQWLFSTYAVRLACSFHESNNLKTLSRNPLQAFSFINQLGRDRFLEIAKRRRMDDYPNADAVFRATRIHPIPQITFRMADSRDQETGDTKLMKAAIWRYYNDDYEHLPKAANVFICLTYDQTGTFFGLFVQASLDQALKQASTDFEVDEFYYEIPERLPAMVTLAGFDLLNPERVSMVPEDEQIHFTREHK